MLFNSFEYLALFLPLVFCLFFLAGIKRNAILAKLVLLFASVFFYAFWKIGYLPILVSSILLNYGCGSFLRNRNNGLVKRIALSLGILFNLALLGYYKYLDFLIDNINRFLQLDLAQAHLLLPLAISFYTFQQIAYLVDSYRGKVAAPGILNYSLFVCFFPQLIAGPIVHHAKIVPQFKKEGFLKLDQQNIKIGLFFIAVGFFKKTVLADFLAPVAQYGFDSGASLPPHIVAFCIVAYTFQLYFDFSGYTDMATGAARLFNIRLPLNFNSPYKSHNIREFWRRWHITLNDFMTRYVYGPLRGNVRDGPRPLIAIAITFVLVGIWHGAGWNFVLFGALHAIGVVFVTVNGKRFQNMSNILAIALTFLFFSASLILFRSSDVTSALSMTKSLIDFSAYSRQSSGAMLANELDSVISILDYFVVLICAVICFFIPNSNELSSKNLVIKNATALSLTILLFALCFDTTTSEFIYFNF